MKQTVRTFTGGGVVHLPEDRYAALLAVATKLAKVGHHHIGCPRGSWGKAGRCICGWDKACKALRDLRRSQDSQPDQQTPS